MNAQVQPAPQQKPLWLRELARDIHHALCDDGLAPLSPTDNHNMREVIENVLASDRRAADLSRAPDEPTKTEPEATARAAAEMEALRALCDLAQDVNEVSTSLAAKMLEPLGLLCRALRDRRSHRAAPEGAGFYFVDQIPSAGWCVFANDDRRGWFYNFGHGDEGEVRAHSVARELNRERDKLVAGAQQASRELWRCMSDRPSEDMEGVDYMRADGSVCRGAWRTVTRKDGLARTMIVYGEMGLALWDMGARALIAWRPTESKADAD